MVHTVSGIVLHRLQRMMHTGDAPYETRVVISEMVRLVKEWDPLFFEKVGAGVIEPDDVTEAHVSQAAQRRRLLRRRIRRAAERPLVAAA